MIILTAFAIGILAVALRSALACALAGCLIVAAFAAAFLLGGVVSWLALALAILGYNAGIASVLCFFLVFARYRPA